jgi:hypothetical protein
MPVRCSALATIEIALRWSPIICAGSCRISGKLRSSQWSRAPNRQRDRHASADVACGGLFCVREQGLFVPYKQASQRRAPIGRRPEIGNAENRNFARQKNHRVGQRDRAAETPKTLSRPTVATSTACPSERRTSIEITPL